MLPRMPATRRAQRPAVSLSRRVDLARYLAEEAHNSTAIEGNTLVLKQVEQLLSENHAVGNKEPGEYLEVQGYGAAANWVTAA